MTQETAAKEGSVDPLGDGCKLQGLSADVALLIVFRALRQERVSWLE